MKQKNSSFPYPILYSSDAAAAAYTGYKRGAFTQKINFDGEADPTKLRLWGTMELSNQADIQTLLADGSACYALHVEAPKSIFRKLYTFPDADFDISLDKDLLRGNVELYPCILTTKAIPKFSSTDFEDDCQGMEFFLPPGIRLAIGNCYSLDLEGYDWLGTIPIVAEKILDPKAELDYEVIADEDKLHIRMKPELFDAYRKWGKEGYFLNTGLVAIVLPAISFALQNLDKADWRTEIHAPQSWRRFLAGKLLCLENKCKKKKAGFRIDLDPMVFAQGSLSWAAQMLLQTPYRGLAEELNKEK